MSHKICKKLTFHIPEHLFSMEVSIHTIENNCKKITSCNTWIGITRKILCPKFSAVSHWLMNQHKYCLFGLQLPSCRLLKQEFPPRVPSTWSSGTLSRKWFLDTLLQHRKTNSCRQHRYLISKPHQCCNLRLKRPVKYCDVFLMDFKKIMHGTHQQQCSHKSL